MVLCFQFGRGIIPKGYLLDMWRWEFDLISFLEQI